ncbi:hypothetical protein B1C81_03305 [Streptomyces sp. HG99]|nr:hypothetical protein B1C81_03305 [Streptomyces sp. HG99]
MFAGALHALVVCGAPASLPDQTFSPPPPLPVPYLGAAAPRPPRRPERPRSQTPEGLKFSSSGV